MRSEPGQEEHGAEHAAREVGEWDGEHVAGAVDQQDDAEEHRASFHDARRGGATPRSRPR